MNSEVEGNEFIIDCDECYGKPSDYDCVACLCHVCLRKTTSKERYWCFLCLKAFHDWCRPNRNVALHPKWLCNSCEGERRNVLSCRLSSDNEERPCTSSSADANSTVASTRFAMDCKRGIVDRVFSKIISSPKKRKMHHAPRSHVCTVVPPNHFGPIPGIEVGTSWKYRLQVSESGVHRPLVAGIHGRETEGAFSIVLSGVYDEDRDNGNEFFYSGCGGKERDPKKRLGPQVKDQELSRHNLALALCCNAQIDKTNGAEAVDWKAGKPIRVVRNCKAKQSKYSPEEGYRYDGIYKLVKYAPEIGSRGFKVWRYFLRRDDPSPAPWTVTGQRRIEHLKLKLIVPNENLEECKVIENQPVKLKAESEPVMPMKRRRTIMPPVNAKKKKRADKNDRRHDEIDEQHHGVVSVTRSMEHVASAEPTAATLASDVDVKPDIRELSQKVAASTNLPWAFADSIRKDVKPDVETLNRLMSLRSSANVDWEQVPWNVSNVKIESSQSAPAIKIEHSLNSEWSSTVPTEAPTSTLDIEEDVKPDVNAMNAEIFRTTGIVVDHEALNTRPSIAEDGVVSTDVRVKNVSLHSRPSSVISSSDISLDESPARSDRNAAELQSRSEDSLKLVISNIHSNAKTYEVVEQESNGAIPSVLSAGNLLNNNNLDLVDHECVLLDLPVHIDNLIRGDRLNKYLWDYLRTSNTFKEFTERTRIIFACPQCHRIVDKPHTTPCGHNICNCCLERWFQQKTYSCPSCHRLLGSDFICYPTNEDLGNVLETLFPGYNLKLSALL